MEPDAVEIRRRLPGRGSQTPGELKQRGERLHSFAELARLRGAYGETSPEV